jgi:putative ABC transport system substrate-binding protein
VTASAAAIRYRDLIISLAARHKLPAVYWERFYIADGGLISFGPDLIDNYRQAPSKYETVINLNTAKALSLTFPPAVLARADDVIE